MRWGTSYDDRVDLITLRRPGAAASPVRWLSGRALRLHATLLVVGGGCLYAGWFELSRARSGNELSWVYTFEWPLFAAFAAVIWWRSLHDDDKATPDTPASDHVAAATGTTAATVTTAETAAAADTRLPETGTAPAGGGDEQLKAWQEYVARLNAEHPPGGPPPRRARRALPDGRGVKGGIQGRTAGAGMGTGPASTEVRRPTGTAGA